MEPGIQYARTADGVSIAFRTLGEGAPLVSVPIVPWSHIQVGWQMPDARHWYERLAEKRKLVGYDGRGSGLSQRDVTDYSLDALVLDLEAVVDRLGLEKFALFGLYVSGPVAIAYAARHPERVSHLILWCSWARGSDVPGAAQVRAARAFIDLNWETYTETVAGIFLGWSQAEAAHRFAAYMRECTTPEAAQAALEATNKFDVTELLPQLKMPTLVLHRRQLRFPEVSLARDLASRIPEARLVVLEGDSMAPYLGDTEPVVRTIEEFLGEGEEVAEPEAPSGLVTILFTDIEASTTLTQRLGDAKAQELLHTHNTIVRDALKAHGGREIKHTGDGIMASFPSASGAIECAIAIQRAVAVHVEAHADSPLRVRVGLNTGEPVAEEKDLFGTAVQLARRICDHAGPGEIVVPIVVRELAAGKGFLFSDRGDVALRGFEDPVRLYEVRWQENV